MKVLFRLAVAVFLLSPLAVPASAAYTIGTLTLTGVFPRIFTPNSDGFNDKAGFHFDNPEQLPITGKIFDISGAQVADLIPGSDPTTLMLWDGKDSSGRVVPGGIYLYRIEFEGEQFTGTVIVAR